MPKLNPAQAAAAAINQYDTDQNGTLSESELRASNSLHSAMAQLDANADNEISVDEIEQRLQSWLDNRQALLVLPCEVSYRGKLIDGATVTLIPEEFLGDVFRPAAGVTDDYGVANLAHAKEDRPDPEFPQGVRVGFYRVEISKEVDGKETLPKKFNTESTLGQEVAPGAAGLGQGMLKLDLR